VGAWCQAGDDAPARLRKPSVPLPGRNNPTSKPRQGAAAKGRTERSDSGCWPLPARMALWKENQTKFRTHLPGPSLTKHSAQLGYFFSLKSV